ncbi:NAD(P)H-dependent oxidoreductase [Sinanaerobacter sp. ZZT-01]|uniref:flavodoxin family protein n=1 Tax=Sinanaerobacter sp. ZZT-01 TaxID=3111540 RepID=UPI002D791F4D|nr:NAD(P)H-dependent oxidoreductase [Sinanaerobacter sp. ZZT-01]WRR92246.1 NAD(P)H-dependent oxidoreductase [Sinanaerobacter sp. ZZT-01]
MTNRVKEEKNCEERMLYVIRPVCAEPSKTKRLDQVLEFALEGIPYKKITTIEDFQNLKGKRLLFAVNLGESGINLEYYQYLKEMRLHPDLLKNCVGGLILDGSSELYTKSVARELVFAANQAGCTFPGRPLVEGTRVLFNFKVQAKNLNTDCFSAYLEASRILVHQIVNYEKKPVKEPKLLVLHASNHKTSNTMTLWNLVKESLEHCFIQEISLRNGAIQDCAGCPYTMCMHYSADSKCYYGGVVVEQVYPAISECDALVMLCPNYNDAVSANVSASINRLTALFRKQRFYEKKVFALIVSGYSGGDIVAQQLIGALNMNKSFTLPEKFCMLETANDPGSILQINGIAERAEAFAHHIQKCLCEKAT